MVEAKLGRPVVDMTDVRDGRILRVNLGGEGPASIIVKCALSDAVRESLYGDWAGLEFLGALDPTGPWPVFYGGDLDRHIMLIEDITGARQLDQILLKGTAGEARKAMTALAHSMARMHATAHDALDNYRELRGRLGARSDLDPARYVLNFARRAEQFGFDNVNLSAELRRCINALRNPGAFATYTHGDPCPDNCILVNERAALIDFEWGEIRHALADGVHLWLPFPSCWCVNRLEDGLSQILIDTYRAGIVDAIPEAGDDRLLGPGLTAATVAGLEAHFGTDPFEDDYRWGISTYRQRWRMRLDIIDETARLYGFKAISTCAMRLLDEVEKQWPGLEPMPLYPAFAQ